MPDFQPLTLTLEEWNDCTLRGRPSMIAKLKVEVEAQSHRADEWQTIAEQRERALDERNATLTDQAREADSLRQRLEDERAEFAVKLEQARNEPSDEYLLACAQADVQVLRQQLEQVQKSAEGNERVRRKLTDSVHFWMDKAEHAEAQLAGLQRMLDEFESWLLDRVNREGPTTAYDNALAQFQAARIALGDQAHAGKDQPRS